MVEYAGKPSRRRWTQRSRRILVLSIAAILIGAGTLVGFPLIDPWQTVMNTDLNSGDYKIEEKIFGQVTKSRVWQGNFSRQLRQYVNPVPVVPRWVRFAWHDHLSGGRGDGTGIGPHCDELAGWMDVYETDAATRTTILRRMAAELANQDEDGIDKERLLFRK